MREKIGKAQRDGNERKKRHCDHFYHLPGAAFKLYVFARMLTAGRSDGRFFCSDANTARRLRIYGDTVALAKTWLVREGWFELKRSNRESGRTGRYKPSEYRIVGHEEWAHRHPGQCLPPEENRDPVSPSRSNTVTVETVGGKSPRPSGVFPVDRQGKTTPQVLILDKRNTKGVSLIDTSTEKQRAPRKAARAPATLLGAKTDLRPSSPACPGKSPDPRHDRVAAFYSKEFEGRHRGVSAALDGSDHKALAALLRRQPQASAKEVISWLRNAFESTKEFPLLPGFRLREFCSHFAKYVDAPLWGPGGKPEFTPSRHFTEDEVARAMAAAPDLLAMARNRPEPIDMNAAVDAMIAENKKKRDAAKGTAGGAGENRNGAAGRTAKE